jgi:hypothetical protein
VKKSEVHCGNRTSSASEETRNRENPFFPLTDTIEPVWPGIKHIFDIRTLALVYERKKSSNTDSTSKS